MTDQDLCEKQFEEAWSRLPDTMTFKTHFTIDGLKDFVRVFWYQSREMFQSGNGKKGGLAKGDCKKRNKDDPDYYKNIKKPVLRICEICNGEFVTDVPNQKTCSEKCSREKRLAYQREIQRKRYREKHPIVQRVRKNKISD